MRVAATSRCGDIVEERRRSRRPAAAAKHPANKIEGALARGEREALDRLREVAALYRELGMPGEAGFVNLDVTAELLAREEWTDAEILARELVTLFMAAGVTIASVYALDYLRSAVENREATAETVRCVRSYVAAGKQSQPVNPPPPATPN